MPAWLVYLVRTRHGALYAGVTTNLARRLAEHGGTEGRGAKYLRAKGPLALAYQAEMGSRKLTLKVERRIKALSKRRKEEIVASAPDARNLLRLLGLGETPAYGIEGEDSAGTLP